MQAAAARIRTEANVEAIRRSRGPSARNATPSGAIVKAGARYHDVVAYDERFLRVRKDLDGPLQAFNDEARAGLARLRRQPWAAGLAHRFAGC